MRYGYCWAVGLIAVGGCRADRALAPYGASIRAVQLQRDTNALAERLHAHFAALTPCPPAVALSPAWRMRSLRAGDAALPVPPAMHDVTEDAVPDGETDMLASTDSSLSLLLIRFRENSAGSMIGFSIDTDSTRTIWTATCQSPIGGHPASWDEFSATHATLLGDTLFGARFSAAFPPNDIWNGIVLTRTRAGRDSLRSALSAVEVRPGR